MFIRRENFKQFIKFYPVVSAIIALNLIVYIITLLPNIGDWLYIYGVNVNSLLANGQWWRLVTSIFVHAGLMHVLLNMFSLFLFGPELEKIGGKARFLTIYLLSGIFGNVATFLFQDPLYASTGASGAIYGIFGAFAALVYYTRNTIPQLKQVILPLIVIGVIVTFVSPGVNATAHLGGLIVGFLLGLSYFSPKNIIRWRKG